MRTALTLIVVAFMASYLPLSAASDFYMKIDGVEGEAVSPGHEKWIEILSFSWGEATRTQPASGLPTGKRQHRPLTISKELDKSSTKLMESCSNGSPQKSVRIELIASGATGQREPYLIIEMKDVIITSYAIGGSSSDDGPPREEVTMTYSEITWTYSKEGKDEQHTDPWKPAK